MTLVSRLPAQVGFGTGTGAVADYLSPYTVTIGGIGFTLAAGTDTPLIRRGADYRNEAINFSSEPGEVALGFWWQRSQSSWHFGAGAPTLDGPGSGDASIAVTRFNDSFGVNPWVAGQLSLLPDTNRLTTVSAGLGPVSAIDAGGTARAVWADGNQLRYWNGSVQTITWGGTNTIQAIATDGTRYFAADTTGVWSGTLGGAAGVKQYTITSGTRFALRWVKQRLLLGIDNVLYELPNAATPPAALPTAKFTHPSSTWRWTTFADGPGAIYAAGYSGTSSAVYKFILDTDGAVPTLTTGITAAELPAGELALALCPYIGGFIAIGTSQGLRVCSFSGTDIVLAPLTLDFGSAVNSVVGWSKYLYATVADAGEGMCGLARVDLSRLTEVDQYGWARDVRANTNPSGFTGVVGNPTGVVMVGGSPTFLVAGSGIYQQDPTRIAQAGELTIGQIILATADDKIFQRVLVRALGQGTVAVSSGVDTGTPTTTNYTLDLSQANNLDAGIGPVRGGTLSLKFRLARFSNTIGPLFKQWMIKALPGQSREENLVIPLQCYDRTEMPTGETGFRSAASIIESIRGMVRSQDPVLVQTFFGDPDYDWKTWLAQVENFEFRQITSEPDAGWGGIMTVSLRTVSGE